LSQASRSVQVDARPNPLTLELTQTAVIVVDMQNDFVAEGGMFARAGLPVSAAQAVVEPTGRVLAGARAAGMKVVYLKMGFESDLSNLGGPDSPNRIRHLTF
jgi:nicotinamidase-related amidase